MLKNLLLTACAMYAVNAANAQCMVLSCNSTITVSNDPGQCGAVVNYTTPVVTSNTCAGSVSDTFQFTGAMQTFVVPVGITSVRIETWGAQGGANWVNNINYGGYVAADVPVTPGSNLYVYVGGQATTITGGFNGGGNGEGAGKGGGGASDVRIGGTTYNDRVVVAGGGGGAGYWSALHVVGGQGGGLTGGNGYRDPNYATNPGGQGGTQTSSGNGTCVSLNNPAVAGGFGYGGNVSGCGCEGYGGGGGWWGGAGSGNCRGGGGGSGYTIPAATNVVMNTGTRTGNGMVIISYTGASVATVTQTSGLPDGSFFPAGNTVNTFIASDAFGNSDTCTFNVYVTDVEVPVLTGIPSNIVLSADSGVCSTVATWSTPSMTDNCTVTLNADYSSGSTFNVGTTTVTYVAADAQGNADSASFSVTVVDMQTPWWTSFPQDTTVATDANQCTAVFTWAPAAAADNCSIDTIMSSANSGDAFPIGANIVTYVVVDGSGNSDTATFTITVIDSEAPTIVCPNNVTVNADTNMCSASGVNLGVATVMDNCAASSTNDAPSVFTVGVTIVTYTAVDSSGNMTTCQQTVTVLDTQAPVIINCPNDMNACEGVVVFSSTPAATDNCSATLTQVSGPSSGDSLTAGQYVVLFVATDSSGNVDSCSFTITVSGPPTVTLTLPFSTVCVTDGAYVLQGGSPAGGVWSGPGVSGNMFSPATAGNGTHTITYTYTDANGCYASAISTVVVSPCTGISETGMQTFTMFPNPATNYFTFNATELGTIEMFDSNGKLVFSQPITASQTEITLPGLAAGSYNVRFTGESGTVSSGKLIVQD